MEHAQLIGLAIFVGCIVGCAILAALAQDIDPRGRR